MAFPEWLESVRNSDTSAAIVRGLIRITRFLVVANRQSLELGDSGGGGRNRLVPGRIGVDTPLAKAFQFGVAAG